MLITTTIIIIIDISSFLSLCIYLNAVRRAWEQHIRMEVVRVKMCVNVFIIIAVNRTVVMLKRGMYVPYIDTISIYMLRFLLFHTTHVTDSTNLTHTYTTNIQAKITARVRLICYVNDPMNRDRIH